MEMVAGIQACVAWKWLFRDGILEEPEVDYDGMLDRMEAEELLLLMEKLQERLNGLGLQAAVLQKPSGSLSARKPTRLFIDKSYNIRLDGPVGPSLPLRPLLKAVFILFLKHPEGIRLKERDRYEEELADIYKVIIPNTDAVFRESRIRRLMDIADNSFSEKTSALNARLEELLPGSSGNYKVQGANGCPRRIPLDPLLVTWQ